jgi:hypothetical protein
MLIADFGGKSNQPKQDERQCSRPAPTTVRVGGPDQASRGGRGSLDVSPLIEGALVRKDLLSLATTESPNPWAGVLLSDQEALQIIAMLADVHDGHDVRDAVGAAWSLLSNRLGAQAGVADPRPEYLVPLQATFALLTISRSRSSWA